MILFLYNKNLEKSNINFIDMFEDISVQTNINIETFDFTPYDIIIIVNDFIRLGGINTNIDSFVKVMNDVFKKEVIYIYDGKEDFDISTLVKSYKVNLNALNSNTLKEIITGIVPELPKDNTDELLIERAFDILDNFSYDKLIAESSIVKMIINDYLATKEKNYDLIHKLRTKESIITQKEKLISNLEDENKVYLNAYESNFQDYIDLKVLYDKISFNIKQERNVINIDKYSKAPICIYLKEITHIKYYTTYLQVLYETIKTRMNLSVKVLRVVDKIFNKQLPSLPPEYYVGLEECNIAKIITSDFILKQGEYTATLDILLNNNMDLDVLVISDETALDYEIIEGDFLATFNILNNYKEIPRYNLDIYSVISNDGTDDMLLWKHIDNFEKIKPSILLYQLSEMSAVTEILKTIEFILESVKGGESNE